MTFRVPTPVYRIIHRKNLHIYLQRRELHAPNFNPNDGLNYHVIHHGHIQQARSQTVIPCGPGGTIHDYVPFYFGARSPMLYQIHHYAGGQEPIIYLVAHAQDFQQAGIEFVFSDGHGIMAYTSWYDDLNDLEQLDWQAINAKLWFRTEEEPDRQRRKQAEFLVWKSFDWSLIKGIGVCSAQAQNEVERIIQKFPGTQAPLIKVIPEWYY